VNYQHFDFATTRQAGPYFGTERELPLQLTLNGDLPPTFNAGPGFHDVTVDPDPPPKPTASKLHPHDVVGTLQVRTSAAALAIDEGLSASPFPRFPAS